MRSAGARSAEVAVRHDAHSNILNIGCEVASASAALVQKGKQGNYLHLSASPSE